MVEWQTNSSGEIHAYKKHGAFGWTIASAQQSLCGEQKLDLNGEVFGGRVPKGECEECKTARCALR